jgi:pimeloyl-ACP methyl ester carboxylesterase
MAHHAKKNLWPAIRPPKFDGFPKEMAVRPSQIRASAAESALMIPDAFRFQNQYAQLKMPVGIVAGEDDRLIDTNQQSGRLHADVVQSTFHRVPGNGHMVHQTATGAVMEAISEVARAASSRTSSSTNDSSRAIPMVAVLF